jgi:hypothetical protein
MCKILKSSILNKFDKNRILTLKWVFIVLVVWCMCFLGAGNVPLVCEGDWSAYEVCDIVGDHVVLVSCRTALCN